MTDPPECQCGHTYREHEPDAGHCTQWWAPVPRLVGVMRCPCPRFTWFDWEAYGAEPSS